MAYFQLKTLASLKEALKRGKENMDRTISVTMLAKQSRQ